MKKLISILLFSLFLFGCAGLGDYDIDLPGNYSVIKTSGDEITIAPKIGEGLWGENVIPTKVVEVGWNNSFIFCKQTDVPSEKDYYWILNMDSKEIEGPLEYDDFESKLVEYGIDKIELKDVETLR